MPPISGSEALDGARVPAAWLERQAALRAAPRTWLVTGAAGFIGSHLVETLLGLGQFVVGLDNFSTGFRHNLDDVAALVGSAAWSRFVLVEGDLRDAPDCARALHHPVGGPVRHVLHQAALGSVPRSLNDPLATHDHNVTGFLQLLLAAREAGVDSLVYASSSSVYGDHPGLPKVEEAIGNALSPYAVSKRSDELYADVFARSYGLRLTGLRYFNVFGPRQDPHGAYAAVIPLWLAALLRGETLWINGDGETSRDFCFVANAVQANVLAALQPPAAEGGVLCGRVFNVAVGARSTLNELAAALVDALRAAGREPVARIEQRAFRAGDVRHSLADISRIAAVLGYQPSHTLRQGIALTAPWYLARLG